MERQQRVINKERRFPNRWDDLEIALSLILMAARSKTSV